MMYLTRIPLNSHNRKFMNALNSPSLFHGAVESSFEGGRKRRLWRIDRLNEQYYMLILSEDIPELSAFCEQFGCDIKSCETKSYDKLLERIENGSRWHFRLTANPTFAKKQSGSMERGKHSAHITPKHQKKWLMKKSEINGFILDEDNFEAVNVKWYKFKKGGIKNISLFGVVFEGILEVSDKELFVNALINGIGRGKAYGMGMLTIMSLR